jgi:pyrroloquinoline quinone biosynthesis protein D
MRAEIAHCVRPRLAPGVRLDWDPLRRCHVLLRPEGLLVVNGTGAAILERCDGAHSIASIAAELGVRYGREGPQATEEIVAFLQRLARKRVVVCDGS